MVLRVRQVCVVSEGEDSTDNQRYGGWSSQEESGESDVKNHLIGECPKSLRSNNQRAFIGGAWSDSGEDEEEKTKDETCLVAQESNEICLGINLEPNERIKDSGCSKHMTGKYRCKLLPYAILSLVGTEVGTKEVDELKAERLVKTQDPLALMENSHNPYTFPAPHQDQPSFNQNYMQQPMPNPEEITDPTTATIMTLALMAKAFKLNYSTPTNNNQRISSNPRNRQIAQPGMNMGQDR
nr:Gag-Pol polyprotein [Tanacetum cinerariifolium]